MKYTKREQTGFLTGIMVFAFTLIMPEISGLDSVGQKTLAVAALMAIWWITEAIPIPATALLPLALFPLLGIMDAKKSAASYGHHFIFLFMGGFFLAMAVQKWGVHRRIALYIIRFIGTSPNKIVLGFMVATAFLSMWISNTATTIMMLPIGLAVITHIKENPSAINPGNFNTALLLGIAYSASIGGIGTLIGTPPNIVFAGSVKSLFPGAEEVGYFQWMLIGIPTVIIFLPLCWFLLTKVLYPVTFSQIPGGKELINIQIKELGPPGKEEKMVLVVLIAATLGWFFRKDIHFGLFSVPGWAGVLGVEKYAQDSTVAILAALILFATPVNFKKGVFLLDWESAVKIPWGLLILFGGGIALASGFKESGLATWIGGSLAVFSGFPVLLIVLFTCLLMTFLTEVTSNTASTAIFMPILASTAEALNLHPFLLMVPATLSASCAFMLPVATPPNAIMFGTGHITMKQMSYGGLLMNLAGVIIITCVVYFIAIPVFNITPNMPDGWLK